MTTKRAFEKMNLSAEEEGVAKKICKLYKFTKSYPNDYEIATLKAFAFGVGIINMLSENHQFYVLLHILTFVTSVKDFVFLTAAAEQEFFDLFWTPGSKMMKQFANHFMLKTHFHKKPNKYRLNSLTTGAQLLREYRVLQAPKIKYKIDGSGFLPSNNLTMATFNPIYPLVAVSLHKQLFIIAYGGEQRKQRGQIVFAADLEHQHCRFRSINWSPAGDFLLSLEEEKEHYTVLDMNRIKVYFYDSKKLCMNEIRFKGEEELYTAHTMNTKFLWLDETSFIFCSLKKGIIRIINLKKDGNYDEKKIDFSPILSDLVLNPKRTKYESFVSHLLVLPDPSSPYHFFLTCCPLNHQHQRLVYVDKITLCIKMIANLPGEVVEISVSTSEFFLLLQSRSTEDWQYNSPVLSPVKEKTDLKKCPLTDPWMCKQNSIRHHLVSDGILLRGNSVSLIVFRESCCSRIWNAENLLKEGINSKRTNLMPYLASITKANNLFFTDDYIYYTDRLRQVTFIRGLYHHFEFRTCLKNDFLIPAHDCLVYFHPKKSIFLRKANIISFDIYLGNWATDDDIDEYPESNDENTKMYNDCITFVRNT